MEPAGKTLLSPSLLLWGAHTGNLPHVRSRPGLPNGIPTSTSTKAHFLSSPPSFCHVLVHMTILSVPSVSVQAHRDFVHALRSPALGTLNKQAPSRSPGSQTHEPRRASQTRRSGQVGISRRGQSRCPKSARQRV